MHGAGELRGMLCCHRGAMHADAAGVQAGRQLRLSSREGSDEGRSGGGPWI